MRLWCKIGWHAAQDGGRWNRGLYFSRCRHCGRDLIRTANGRWQEPRGYRVVWATPGKASLPHPTSADTPEAAPAAVAGMASKEPWEARLEVAARRRIASLDRGDFMGDAAAPAASSPLRPSMPDGDARARKVAG